MVNKLAIGVCRVSRGTEAEIRNSLNSQKYEIEEFCIRELGLSKEEIEWRIEHVARSAYQERADWSYFNETIDIACNNKFKYLFFSFISFIENQF